MTRPQAVGLMVLVTLLWSMAGVVSRQMDVAQGLTLTFWRSAFNALALLLVLTVLRTPGRLVDSFRHGGWPLWASGACWGVMFTAFMWALTLTTVANVLVTMALGPLITAVLARWFLRQRLSGATVAAVVLAGSGLVLMQWPALTEVWGSPGASNPVAKAADLALHGSSGHDHLAGLALALLVPTAGALNWVLIRSSERRERAPHTQAHAPDFLLSVLIGAVLSCLLAWWGAEPTEASATDLAWLALLGVFQLAVPCLLAVQAAKVLQPAEVALLSLLEVIFGVAWAWMATSEQPQVLVAVGGLMVIFTLTTHEGWNWWRRR